MRRVLGPITALLLAGTASAGVVELVSRAASPGGPTQTAGGNSYTYGRCLSADGRYLVFMSAAPNIVSGFQDGNGTLGYDVFVFDRVAGTNQIISASVTNAGTTGNADSRNPAISADGRWVAFESSATDLVAGLTSPSPSTNIFLFDRTTGVTRLASHSHAGASQTPNAMSNFPSLSGDGRWVSFTSLATDFLPGQSGSPTLWNVYLWDRDSGAITLVSHAPGAPTTPGTGNSMTQRISMDGSTVAFTSDASNLAPAAGAQMQVHSFDRATGGVRLVSHAVGLPGTGSNGWATVPDVSGDGRFISYQTTATNIVASQSASGTYPSVFLWDGISGSSVLVSRLVGSSATSANASSQDASLSADGRFVAFTSAASDLVPGFVDRNSSNADVYLFDVAAGANTLLSHAAGNATAGANQASGLPSISGDGSRVTYHSSASDLVAGVSEGNADADVFVFDRLGGTTTVASRVPGQPLKTANGSSGLPIVSANGAVIVYQTLSTNLFGPLVVDQNGLGDLAVFDMATQSNTLASSAAPDARSLSGGGTSQVSLNRKARAVSADGRYVVYASGAANLSTGQVDANGALDVFLADRWAGTTSLVSHTVASTATAGNFYSTWPALSADGRWVAYSSSATDLVAGISKDATRPDVFLYDRLSGGNALLSRRAGAPVSGNGSSLEAVVSGDGKWVAFSSTSTDLVTGVDTNGVADVFLYDRAAGTLSLVSHSTGAVAAAAGESTGPSISSDGGVLVFTSRAPDLTPGETGGTVGVYAFDRTTGTVSLVSHVAGQPSRRAAGDVFALVSADGRWVAYQSMATDLVPAQTDTNASLDVFLWDRQTDATLLVSHSLANPAAAGNASSGITSLSDDGRFVGFASAATDLAPGVPLATGNAYVFDRTTGVVELVSRTAAGIAGNGGSSNAIVSGDGARVAFTSYATDLIAGFVAPAVPTAQHFLLTRATGLVQLASGGFASPNAGGDGEGFSLGGLSADGNVVVYDSYATNLVPGDFNGTSDVFAFRSMFLGPPASFATITPCRVADTRGPAGPWGAPPLAPNASRTLVLAGRCGIPLDAVAVSANVTVVAPAADGTFTFYPAGFAAGGTSTLSYGAGQTRANNAILGLGAGGATAVDVASPGPAHLVLDVNGYFK